MKIFLYFYIVCSSFSSCLYIFQLYNLILKIKSEEFFGCPCSSPLYKKDLCLKDLVFFLNSVLH